MQCGDAALKLSIAALDAESVPQGSLFDLRANPGVPDREGTVNR